MPTGIYIRKPVTEEVKKKRSERMKGNQFAKGMKLSEKHKQQIREGIKKYLQNLENKEKRMKQLREFHNLNRGIHPKTEFKKGEHFGEESYVWKGNKVGMRGLHNWIRRHKPKIEFCERCNEIKELELANISGNYKRDIDDFKWLCYSCHMKMDFELGMRKVTEKTKLNMSLAHRK